MAGPEGRTDSVPGLVSLVLDSLGYQDADTGEYTYLIIETAAASLAGAALGVGVVYGVYRLWGYMRSGCPVDDPLRRAFNLLGASSDTSSVNSYLGRFRRAESIPDFYAGIRRSMRSFNIYGRDEPVGEDVVSVRSDPVESPRSRREDGAIPRTYPSSQVNPRSNGNQPGVQVSSEVPVLESVVRIPPPPPVMGLAARIPPPPPVMGLAARIPPPPPVMEMTEECEPEDEDGAASFSQQILQARERMVLRSSKREKGEKPCE